jgi:ABC-type glycerol-3-phosphate transport system permease component
MNKGLVARLQLAGSYSFLMALLVIVVFPFYWMTVTSFKGEDQMRSLVSMFWPSPPVTENYEHLLRKTEFVSWFRNSVFVSISSTFVATAIGTIGAYALARLKFLGRAFMSSAVLITYLVPPSILFIPLYAQIRTLGLADSLGGLIAAYPSFTIPFVTWLLMGYFESIPVELEEAAMIDGCRREEAFVRVVLPLIGPGLVATGIFGFIQAWNEYIIAYVLLSTNSRQTLTVWLASFTTNHGPQWGPLMAAATLTGLPVVAFFLLLQRNIAGGLTSGAVKG